MTEYPITPAYKILGQLLAAALIVCGIIVINTFRTAVPSGQAPLIVMGTIIALLGGWLMYGATRLCVTVDDDAVRVRGALGKRELPVGEIDGYRYGDKNRFYLVRKNGRGFIIPDYLSQRDELIEWIRSRYGDVDARERAAETKELLQDERYGATEEDRKATLKKARTIAWICNPASVVLSVFLLWLPGDGSMFYLLYAIPWVAILLTWRSNGMIRLSARKSTPHPTLLYAMLFPAVFLGIGTPIRFHFYGFPAHAWSVAALAVLAAAVLAGITLRETIALEKQKLLTVILLVIIAGFYGFGVAASSNCLLDRSIPQTLDATVVWKKVKHGKTTSYDLELSPWGRYTDGNTVTVSRDFFYRVHRNDTLHILLSPGKWGLPWYRVTDAQ